MAVAEQNQAISLVAPPTILQKKSTSLHHAHRSLHADKCANSPTCAEPVQPHHDLQIWRSECQEEADFHKPMANARPNNAIRRHFHFVAVENTRFQFSR